MGNQIQAVVDELNARGLIAFNEYPGVVHVPYGEFWAGTANDTWMVDRMSPDGGEVLDAVDTGIASCVIDIQQIANAIEISIAHMLAKLPTPISRFTEFTNAMGSFGYSVEQGEINRG